MLVEFKVPWFAPSMNIIKDKIQHISGRRFKKGVHEVDDSLRDVLPTNATVLKEPPKKEIVVESDTLMDYDQLRSADSKMNEMISEADKQNDENKKRKQAQMALARTAKGAKRGNATVE